MIIRLIHLTLTVTVSREPKNKHASLKVSHLLLKFAKTKTTAKGAGRCTSFKRRDIVLFLSFYSPPKRLILLTLIVLKTKFYSFSKMHFLSTLT